MHIPSDESDIRCLCCTVQNHGCHKHETSLRRECNLKIKLTNELEDNVHPMRKQTEELKKSPLLGAITWQRQIKIKITEHFKNAAVQ